MRHEGHATGEMHRPEAHGLAISRDAWLAHIESDGELQLHHQDDSRVLVSWNGREPAFCHRFGVVTAEAPDAAVLEKLGAIARSESDSGPGRRRSRRRVIPRAKAALFVALSGLLVFAAGASWLDTLRPVALFPTPNPYLPEFLALAMFTTGFVALLAAAGLALSSLLPWERERSGYAATALLVSLLALLFV